jgi:hypothetical protein
LTVVDVTTTFFFACLVDVVAAAAAAFATGNASAVAAVREVIVLRSKGASFRVATHETSRL